MNSLTILLLTLVAAALVGTLRYGGRPAPDFGSIATAEPTAAGQGKLRYTTRAAGHHETVAERAA